MVSIKQGDTEGEFVLSCDGSRCLRAEMTTLPNVLRFEDRSARFKDPQRMAREKLERESGWFCERFPRKPERDFCPSCAPAYRTMYARAMLAFNVIVLCMLTIASCGDVELAKPVDGGPIKGRIESDAGSLRLDLGAAGSGAGGAGSGGATGAGGAVVQGSGGSGSGGAMATDAGPSNDAQASEGGPTVDVGPPSLCPRRASVQVCSITAKTAVCYDPDGNAEVGCLSDPQYLFTCVASCR